MNKASMLATEDGLTLAIRARREELEAQSRKGSFGAKVTPGLRELFVLPANGQPLEDFQRSYQTAEEYIRELLERDQADLTFEEQQDVEAFLTLVAVSQGPLPKVVPRKVPFGEQLKLFIGRVESIFPWLWFVREAVLKFPYEIQWIAIILLLICSIVLAGTNNSWALFLNYGLVTLIVVVLTLVVHVKDAKGNWDLPLRLKTLGWLFLFLIVAWFGVGITGQIPIGETDSEKLIADRSGKLIKLIPKNQQRVYYPTIFDFVFDGQTTAQIKRLEVKSENYQVPQLQSGNLTISFAVAQSAKNSNLIGKNIHELAEEQANLAALVREKIWGWIGQLRAEQLQAEKVSDLPELIKLIENLRTEHFRAEVIKEPKLNWKEQVKITEPKEITEDKSLTLR